jgi:ATP-binding cassette subfamily B protein
MKKLSYYNKYHSVQKDHSDCGVVCLRTILKSMNSDYSLERLRELSGTTVNGTTMLGLLQCANKIGMEAKGFEATIEALKLNNEIAILHTTIEKELQHYIVCFGFNEKKNVFIISNPSKLKVEYLTINELEKIGSVN